MPEYPDIQLYLHALRPRLIGSPLTGIRVVGPSLLRSVQPPLRAFEAQQVRTVSRSGKRIVLSFDDELHLVIHLMIAGRLDWKPPKAKLPKRHAQAAFDFEAGSLFLIERSPRKRASLQAVRGDDQLLLLDRGGLDVFACSESEFLLRLQSENHTLKRALCDPGLFDGIGNAYSDEILHRARLSPFVPSTGLEPAQASRLLFACKSVLREWEDRLVSACKDEFPKPKEITAFRPEMAVHGRLGQPCPVCATAVQRVRFADHEWNYCPGCQTEGRIFADRSLSRLLREDWPRSIEELEEFTQRYRSPLRDDIA